MHNRFPRSLLLSIELFVLFIVFTILLITIDVQPIGPEGTNVGFAVINQAVFQKIGVHLSWYTFTDWLGLFPVLFAFYFAAIGLYQLIKRKSFRKVDSEILILGLFYLTVIFVYLFFEKVIINYRPVMMNGILEASYPSSHTMVVICIMATGVKQLNILYPQSQRFCVFINAAAAIIIAVTVFGRLYSGVHWFTDIIGGLLISSALVSLHLFLIKLAGKEKSKRN